MPQSSSSAVQLSLPGLSSSALFARSAAAYPPVPVAPVAARIAAAVATARQSPAPAAFLSRGDTLSLLPAVSAAEGPVRGLGKRTKYSDTCASKIDAETGEILGAEPDAAWVSTVTPKSAGYDQDASDLARWILKGVARRLLLQIDIRDKRRRVPYSEVAYYTDLATRAVRTACARERWVLEQEYIVTPEKTEVQRKRAPRFRVVNCCRDRVSSAARPEVWYSPASARAGYRNVTVCGSVWTCPVCSRRINLARQRQIRVAYDLCITAKPLLSPGVRDADALLITFTVKHGIGDDLEQLLDALKSADGGQLQKSYTYKRLVGYTRTVAGRRVAVPSSLGYVGRISTTEITHGVHGWHPHLHQLWLLDRRLTDAEIAELRSDLYQAWRSACLAAGLPAPAEFGYDKRGERKGVGVDVRRAMSAEEYLTKYGHDREWGPEREMASQHCKGGKAKGGRTAFQLLYDYSQGDERAGGLFRVFAAATKGRHQLEFSAGLRARLLELGYADVLDSDEALAAASEADSAFQGSLTDADFAALNAAERYGVEAHGELLLRCKLEGFASAIAWLRAQPWYGSRDLRLLPAA